MYTYEPMRHDRQAFCRRFTARHRGARFHFEAGSENGAATPAGAHRLRSLGIEPGSARLAVRFDNDDGTSDVVWAPAVAAVALEQSEAETGGRMIISYGYGDALVLHFDTPLLPGALDAVAAGGKLPI